jgi:uncharacterized membrane protein
MQEFFLSLLSPLSHLHPLIYVLVIAMVPIIELRGAIPIGIIILGLPWWQVFLVATIGSIVPSPVIVYFFKAFLELLRAKNWLPRLTAWLDRKFAHREDAFGQAIFWGIVIFTAIPLPGTGAWTASGIASILELPPKRSILAVAIGCLGAGIIVTLLSIFVPQLLGF